MISGRAPVNSPKTTLCTVLEARALSEMELFSSPMHDFLHRPVPLHSLSFAVLRVCMWLRVSATRNFVHGSRQGLRVGFVTLGPKGAALRSTEKSRLARVFWSLRRSAAVRRDVSNFITSGRALSLHANVCAARLHQITWLCKSSGITLSALIPRDLVILFFDKGSRPVDCRFAIIFF